MSGGENQRIKLVEELSKPTKGHTLYLLDEPTIGLHKLDVAKLIVVLKKLTDRGDSVILIENDADIIQHSDYNITMGPGAGENGGTVVG